MSQFLTALQVYYPFDKFGYNDINFIIQPGNYYMAARITKDGMWRVSYGEDTNLTHQEVVDHQQAKFEEMLPGHPKPDEYKLTNINPYRIHQRCAEKFRVGRICLAADAAHLCNPFGGLGLTGGLVDVGGLFDCLNGIATKQADESILDKYDEVRRHIYHSIIDTISSSNFLRVSAMDPETASQTDEFLALCVRAENDLEIRKEIDQVCTEGPRSSRMLLLTYSRQCTISVTTSRSIIMTRLLSPALKDRKSVV